MLLGEHDVFLMESNCVSSCSSSSSSWHSIWELLMDGSLKAEALRSFSELESFSCGYS